MQRIFNSLLFMSLAVMVVFSTGCGEDTPGGGGGTNPIGPSILLVSSAGLVSTDATVSATAPAFNVQVDLSSGDNSLSALTITEDGVNLPTANLVFDQGSTQAQNPIAILGADQSGTVYDIQITPTIVIPGASSTYTFTVSDSEQLRDEVSIVISFEANVPTLTITGPTGDVLLGDPRVNIAVDAAATDFNLSQIEFYEDGVLLDAANVFDVTNSAALATNPAVLPDGTTSLVNSYLVSPATSPFNGEIRQYIVVVTDEQFGSVSDTIEVTFAGAPVNILQGVIFNADGMQLGGLDLDSDSSDNNNVSRNSPLAEIRDRGININLPASQNWLQSIEPVNGAVLATVNPTDISDTWSFDDVITYEEVIEAFNAGTTVAQSDMVEVGDIFAVERDGNYYLVRVDEVTIDPAANNDSYTLTVINEGN